ncbi:MAG TPA: acyltransferase [Burkholderiales bacterium]|nr:acyltransferase [Burkholderiales bacterium]
MAEASATVLPVHELVREDAPSRIGVLDGWRGISILAVLAAHLLPLGPGEWRLNLSAGLFGMALFFLLSGFLIATFLLERPAVGAFLVRRLCRILPLAWLYLALALALTLDPASSWAAHLLFYANLPPRPLTPLTAHMWSVCIEMQFYVAVALLVAIGGRRGLLALPVLCLAVTGLRIHDEVYASIVTWYRIDEILAGCTLALLCHGRTGERLRAVANRVPQWPFVLLLALSCLMQAGWLNYFRPYLAAILVGLTVLQPRTRLGSLLAWRPLAYVAGISYALYVIHPMLAASWLGSGDLLEKYAKRPLLFLALFFLAHLSTYHYERHWTALGRQLGGGWRRTRVAG